MDLFDQITNAIFDLQAAQMQTYERPLHKLGRLLQHQDLSPFTDQLLKGVDLDTFLKSGEATGGSIIGSQVLPWPSQPDEALG